MVLKMEGAKKVLKQDPNPLVFGITYSFCVEWQLNFNVEKHRFTVTMYPLWEYYIYSHTSENPILFTPQNFIPNISVSNQIARTSSSLYINMQSDGIADNSFVTRSFTAAQAELENDFCPKPEYLFKAEVNGGNQKHCKIEHLQHHLSVMSYNIWNFNTFPNVKGDLFYQTRIKHLTKVRYQW